MVTTRDLCTIVKKLRICLRSVKFEAHSEVDLTVVECDQRGKRDLHKKASVRESERFDGLTDETERRKRSRRGSVGLDNLTNRV